MTILEIIGFSCFIISLGCLMLSYLEQNKSITIIAIPFFIIGILTTTLNIDIKNTQLKPEYTIELISQDSIKIDNGKDIKIIPFNKLEEYIELDNL